MGHLVKLQETYGAKVAIIGVTDAPVDETAAFGKEHGVTYHLLANAEADRDAFGIDLIWGNQVYLVDPNGRIVAQGPDDVDAALARHLG